MTTTNSVKPKVPDHVPAELVWDHDLEEFTRELDDPYLAASRLHEGPGIIWGMRATFGRPAWILTRHALIQEAFTNYEHFSSRDYTGPEAAIENFRMIPLEVDPPEHAKYRRIVNPFFMPRAVNGLEPSVRETCDSLISKFENRGSCEFVKEFASIFPNSVFLTLMGLPQEMLPQFLEWEHDSNRGKDVAKRAEARQAIFHYLQNFVADQRENPQTDLMRGILSGEIEGRPLKDMEIMGIVILLWVGGLDTVYSSLGWIMRYLAGDHSLQERLRANPGDIPRAVEELSRAFAVATTHRTVAKDCTFHGVPMRKEDEMVLPGYLAARDPEAYDNPHTINIDRQTRNVTFATGPHTCLGVHLAKRELRIVLEAFLSRFKNIRIPAGETYEYHTGGVLGVDRLPLEWDRL